MKDISEHQRRVFLAMQNYEASGLGHEPFNMVLDGKWHRFTYASARAYCGLPPKEKFDGTNGLLATWGGTIAVSNFTLDSNGKPCYE